MRSSRERFVKPSQVSAPCGAESGSEGSKCGSRQGGGRAAEDVGFRLLVMSHVEATFHPQRSPILSPGAEKPAAFLLVFQCFSAAAAQQNLHLQHILSFNTSFSNYISGPADCYSPLTSKMWHRWEFWGGNSHSCITVSCWWRDASSYVTSMWKVSTER